MAGVPDFVIHDDVARTFTIPETYDHSLIGSYQVTIDVTIQVPTDHTKSAYTEHNHRQNVLIYVEPCLLTSIDVTGALQPNYSYTIGNGDPDLITEQYAFMQNPDCQYSMTITTSAVPAHVSHDSFA